MASFSKTGLARMREIMKRHADQGDVPGIVWLVARHGDVHTETVGHKAFGGGGAMQRDTIFRIASVSKPMTAAAAMMLVEDCTIRLDDPVESLLPELANRKVLKRIDAELDETVAARRPITLRDLLTFRMGFGQIMAWPDQYPIQRAVKERDLRMLGAPIPATPHGPDEWLRRFAELPLMAQPGETWMYNTGAEILSVLIARASGQPLETFMRERLFEPLGMTDTGFSVPASQAHRLATFYARNPQTKTMDVLDAPSGQFSAPPAFPNGAGGLVSTVHDCFAFAQMMLNKGLHGKTRLLSRATVETMTTNQLTPAQQLEATDFLGGRGWGFGLGVDTTRDNVWRNPGRFGWDGGFGTSWSSDPKEGVTGILPTQRMWESPSPPPVWHDFWTSAYAALE